MASAYSQDLRDRVIDAVVRGKMSRRAAAARFGVSESSAIKWARCARFGRLPNEVADCGTGRAASAIVADLADQLRINS